VKTIGSPRSRIDGWAKVTGRATYAADRRLDHQLYALSVRSPVAAGAITAIEVADALAVPGIVAIYTHENAPDNLDWGPTPAFMALSGEMLGRTALTDVEPEAPPPYLPLSGPEIVFAGQWIAVVVGETLEAVREAFLQVKVTIVPAPSSIHPSRLEDHFIDPGFFFAADMQVRRGGAPDSHAPVEVSETYRTSQQLHHPMEPSATVACWSGDTVTVYDSTQGAMAARDYIARSLRVSPEQVRVVAPYVGGGFGGKNQMWPHQALAAHIARHLDRPVRLHLTRADMAVASGHRSETEQDVVLGAGSDGDLTRISHRSWVPTSMRGHFFEPCGLNTLLLYDTPALDVSHHITRKNIPSPTPFRAPGEAPGSFAVECAMDELAVSLGLNPVELRRRNFTTRDPYHGRDWSSNQLLECYRLGSEAFGWPAVMPPPRALREEGTLIGYGMATTAYPAPALPAAVRLRLQLDGPLVVETSATDIGTGMYTILAQTVADLLCHPFEDIEVRLGDSGLPSAPTAGRSKSTASLLPAAAAACDILRERLADLARSHPLPDMSNRSPVAILQAAGATELAVEGNSTGMAGKPDRSFYSFGAHFVEVRIDEPLGQIRVSRVVSAVDCGRIINPKTATSQIKGGIVMGIGMALMEAVDFHPASDRIVGDNLADYAIPVNADVPDIDVIFVDQPDDNFNRFGARGLGEIGVPGMAAAVANAVYNATGRRFRSLPISVASIMVK
jgi:xanthine dehydrogenase YagR molybdenum-binding subunit